MAGQLPCGKLMVMSGMAWDVLETAGESTPNTRVDGLDQMCMLAGSSSDEKSS